jgi:hypothetical protein
MGMFLFCFCFGTACDAIFFPVAAGTTISSSLAKRDEPVLNLSFFNVYDLYLLWLPWTEKPYRREWLSTVDLLIKMACFKYSFDLERS